jgi:NADPH:quinone reductase-like Zn-dependent oxidoreductase
MGYVIKAFLLSPFTPQVRSMYLASPNTKDLEVLKELIEAGRVTPVIDRTYPLSQAPEAIGYVGRGHTRGKVVISVKRDGETL